MPFDFLRCTICGKVMPVRAVLRQRFGEPRTYPTRTIEGARVETPVARLCDSCDARAEHHRHAPTQEPTPAHEKQP